MNVKSREFFLTKSALYLLEVYQMGYKPAYKTRIMEPNYVYSVSSNLEKLKLIIKRKEGRTNKVTVTAKGKKLAKAVSIILETQMGR